MKYVVTGIDAAHDANAHLIILRIDTAGGLGKALRQIIQRILSSNIPVVAYVSPQGAHAASVGAYILYAVHITGMSPGTHWARLRPCNLVVLKLLLILLNLVTIRGRPPQPRCKVRSSMMLLLTLKALRTCGAESANGQPSPGRSFGCKFIGKGRIVPRGGQRCSQ
jgi:hypothetical protein